MDDNNKNSYDDFFGKRPTDSNNGDGNERERNDSSQEHSGSPDEEKHRITILTARSSVQHLTIKARSGRTASAQAPLPGSQIMPSRFRLHRCK